MPTPAIAGITSRAGDPINELSGGKVGVTVTTAGPDDAEGPPPGTEPVGKPDVDPGGDPIPNDGWVGGPTVGVAVGLSEGVCVG